MEYIELSENQITKKQHYIPKCYLKNFTTYNGQSKQLYISFKENESVKKVSIEDICFRPYLYDQIAVDSDSGAYIFADPNSIENSFVDLEGNYATIISKIKNHLKDSNNFQLSLFEVDILKRFMLSLIFRNPTFVNIIKQIINIRYAQNANYIKKIKNLFPDISPNIFISIFADKVLKMCISPDSGVFPCAMNKTMSNSQICVLKTESSAFITSTMPVVNICGKENNVEYDLLGMPITPHLFLAFVDSIHYIPKVITIDEGIVRRLNGRQVDSTMLISDRRDLLSYIEFLVEIEEDTEWLYEMLHTNEETVLELYKELRNTKEVKYWE